VVRARLEGGYGRDQASESGNIDLMTQMSVIEVLNDVIQGSI